MARKSLNLEGADQTINPRQKEFISNYLNPDSETWGNGLRSAIKAGYSEEYARIMLTRNLEWLSDSVVSDNHLLTTATSNLKSALEGGLDAEKGKKEIQYKATEFVLKGLQRNKWGDKADQQNNIFIKEIIINKSSESDN